MWNAKRKAGMRPDRERGRNWSVNGREHGDWTMGRAAKAVGKRTSSRNGKRDRNQGNGALGC